MLICARSAALHGGQHSPTALHAVVAVVFHRRELRKYIRGLLIIRSRLVTREHELQ